MLYAHKIDLKNKNDSNVLLFEMAEKSARILDVGCACGDLSALLVEQKNCYCTGMEADSDGVKKCLNKKIFEQVVQIDLNLFREENFCEFRENFDTIICGDVLEHLMDPARVLGELKAYLKKDGCFLVSLPNVAHAGIKANLLMNEWEYTELGILDKTHLRFFTAASIADLCATTGLKLTYAVCTKLPPDGYQRRLVSELPKAVAEYVLKDQQSAVFQYIFRAERCEENKRKLALHNKEVLLQSIDDKQAGRGMMFRIKRFLLLKMPWLIKYIQNLR